MRKGQTELSEQRQIGARIRAVRKSKKLSGFAVADKAKVSRYHYYVIERGETAVTAATLGRIAKALGVSADVLLSGEKS